MASLKRYYREHADYGDGATRTDAQRRLFRAGRWLGLWLLVSLVGGIVVVAFLKQESSATVFAAFIVSLASTGCGAMAVAHFVLACIDYAKGR